MKRVSNELDDWMSLTVQFCLGTGSMDECFLYHLDQIYPPFLLPSFCRIGVKKKDDRRVMSNDREVSFRLLAHRAHAAAGRRESLSGGREEDIPVAL